MRSYPVKDNPIGSVVREIPRADRNTDIDFYDVILLSFLSWWLFVFKDVSVIPDVINKIITFICFA